MIFAGRLKMDWQIAAATIGHGQTSCPGTPHAATHRAAHHTTEIWARMFEGAPRYTEYWLIELVT